MHCAIRIRNKYFYGGRLTKIMVSGEGGALYAIAQPKAHWLSGGADVLDARGLASRSFKIIFKNTCDTCCVWCELINGIALVLCQGILCSVFGEFWDKLYFFANTDKSSCGSRCYLYVSVNGVIGSVCNVFSCSIWIK